MADGEAGGIRVSSSSIGFDSGNGAIPVPSAQVGAHASVTDANDAFPTPSPAVDPVPVLDGSVPVPSVEIAVEQDQELEPSRWGSAKRWVRYVPAPRVLFRSAFNSSPPVAISNFAWSIVEAYHKYGLDQTAYTRTHVVTYSGSGASDAAASAQQAQMTANCSLSAQLAVVLSCYEYHLFFVMYLCLNLVIFLLLITWWVLSVTNETLLLPVIFVGVYLAFGVLAILAWPCGGCGQYGKAAYGQNLTLFLCSVLGSMLFIQLGWIFAQPANVGWMVFFAVMEVLFCITCCVFRPIVAKRHKALMNVASSAHNMEIRTK
jgi:hypothetical protein